jgi:two-component system NtrC family sensor kinase
MSDLNLLAIALDSISDPILIHDKDFRVLRANSAAADRLGLHRSALAGRSMATVLGRNGQGWKQCPYCEDVAGKGEQRDHWFGGYLLASTANFHEPVERSVATIHVLRDVTGGYEAEAKYRALFENVQEGVFISTPDGRFLDFNDAFLQITGYRSREELMGVDIASALYVDPSERRHLQMELQRRGAVRDFEFRIRRRDGAIRTVSESSFATRDAAGEVLHYQGFLLDVTERKRAERELLRRNQELTELHERARVAYENLRRTQEQLLQSEKMAAVGQLISGVAHELNNPLTAILGYSQLLADEVQVSGPGAQYIDRLYRQAQRTHRIVQNLLSFARQRPPERQAISLETVLEDTLVLREYELRLNNIRVHRELAPRLPQALADTHQMQQVILNILNNAVDAILDTGRRGEIWIRAWAEGSTLYMAFTDSGPGVADPGRVFDPFYTTKPVGKGTGLGLSICYGLVKEHGGDITVRNVPPHGACFTLSLPALPQEAQPAAQPVAGEAPASFGTVLLVDDEETVLDLEQQILRAHCTRIHTARSGREAIACLEQQRVDAVITDLKMPGEVSGEELFQWIARRRPELAPRVVFTMSDADDRRVRELLRRTGCHHLQKPFRLDDLVGALRKVFAESPVVK